VSELRLPGIRTVEAAQAYLPEFIADFNRRRFGKPCGHDTRPDESRCATPPDSRPCG
jgi:hypothetical protein